MPTYPHSQLSMYEGYPLKYKPCYRGKTKRDIEGVESSLSTMPQRSVMSIPGSPNLFCPVIEVQST